MCVREGFNDPLLYAAEEEAGIGAAAVFGGEDLDGGWREGIFPLDVWVQDQSVGVVPTRLLGKKVVSILTVR